MATDKQSPAQTVVFDDDPIISQLAETTCERLEARADELRDATLGSSFSLGNDRFQLLSVNRNVIYRIGGERTWYLKLPRSEKSSLVERELLGAKIMQSQLGDCAGFRFPPLIRASLSSRYVLIGEVPGGFLQTALYGTLLKPWKAGQVSQIYSGFNTLGEIIARLHSFSFDHLNDPKSRDTGCSTAPAIHASPPKRLEAAVLELDRSFADKNTISDRLSGITMTTAKHLVHANLRRENILFHEGQIGLIDFETCGIDDRHSDLAFIGANLAQTKAALIFPWRKVYRAWSHLLAGYCDVRAIDTDRLASYTLRQLVYVYAKILQGKKPTLARIPISKSKLWRMIHTLHREGFAAAFPNVLPESSNGVNAE